MGDDAARTTPGRFRIGIVGYGTVGKALRRLFASSGVHDVEVYDKYLPEFAAAQQFDAMDECDIVFVAVPTPYSHELGACDISQVEAVIERIRAPVCVKSTIPPGTMDRLAARRPRIAYSPEYLGESPGHPWQEADSSGFVVLAGDPLTCAIVEAAYASSSSSNLQYIRASPPVAELAKYMENCFLATKVAFANQFFALAAQAGVEYDEVRAIVALDPRIGESHTAVSAERGFGGKCLPKDLDSLIAWAGGGDSAPLLQAVTEYNAAVRGVAGAR